MQELGCLVLAIAIIGIGYAVYRIARFALTDND